MKYSVICSEFFVSLSFSILISRENLGNLYSISGLAEAEMNRFGFTFFRFWIRRLLSSAIRKHSVKKMFFGNIYMCPYICIFIYILAALDKTCRIPCDVVAAVGYKASS